MRHLTIAVDLLKEGRQLLDSLGINARDFSELNHVLILRGDENNFKWLFPVQTVCESCFWAAMLHMLHLWLGDLSIRLTHVG